jgi:hypothetical protein
VLFPLAFVGLFQGFLVLPRGSRLVLPSVDTPAALGAGEAAFVVAVEFRTSAFNHASRNAIFFAQMAKRGMTGPDPVFEGRGGYFVAVPIIGVDDGAFWSQMQASVDFRDDILNGVIKSLVFGVVCTMIALFEGYDAPPTAEGVSRATTRTVVNSSLAVLALDFILTSFMISV